jgi:C-terminal processing protease CtpA/Prc
MEVGDEVLAADGVLPIGMSSEDFNLHIKGESGTVVRLTIRRNGRVFDLNVARRRLTW